ncbi:hypothetical protein [Arsukibacterium sp.]|uniref:hypothetical protein n=1 Tax=Arsukibacterium sp. TaxID=1977258 RepID=UPI00299E9D80|nr:hypothetical protein [Arsukibacterium sp.]MDX1539096.1 hypothetical protein [Arsukibacterium sp.]
MFRYLMLSLIVVLHGCATTKTIKNDYILNADTGNGVLATSISYRGSYSGYSIFYQNIESGIRGEAQFGEGVALIPIPPKGDFSHLNRKGEVFAIELAAGTYRVWDWGVHSGYANVSPMSPISIEFKVIPGKVTYLGNFDFVQTDRMGLTVTGVEVRYSDQSKIDLDILLRKQPRIKVEDITFGIERNADYKDLGGGGRTNWDIPLVVM